MFHFFLPPPAPPRPSDQTAEIMLSEEICSGLKSHGLFARFTSVPQVLSTQLQARCCLVSSSGSVRPIRHKCVKLLLTLSRHDALRPNGKPHIFIARFTGFLSPLFISWEFTSPLFPLQPPLKPRPTGLTHLLFLPRFQGLSPPGQTCSCEGIQMECQVPWTEFNIELPTAWSPMRDGNIHSHLPSHHKPQIFPGSLGPF